jgi:hypothetical protein
MNGNRSPGETAGGLGEGMRRSKYNAAIASMTRRTILRILVESVFFFIPVCKVVCQSR